MKNGDWHTQPYNVAAGLLCYENPDLQAWPEADAAFLKRLLECAAKALEQENKALESAFGRREHTWGPELKPVNKSLAYWVFETNLVYTIFKSWLTMIEEPRVEWECPYPKTDQKADLVIRGTGGDTPTLVFECKWWKNNDGETLDSIHNDLKKLRLWQSDDVRHYLVTFWWGWDWKTDWRQVNDANLKQSPPIWAAKFPIHLLRKDKDQPKPKIVKDAYFAMAAFHVK